MPDEPIIIHLVHGTWPEGPYQAVKDALRRFITRKERDWPSGGSRYWFQNGHRFSIELKKRVADRGFEPTIMVFRWSGANSFADRRFTAAVLAASIDRLATLGRRQIVIGHSHGGSIGLQAVNMLEKTQVELVTMATPFLHVARFSSNTALWSAISFWWMAAVGVLYALSARRYGQGPAGLVVAGVSLLFALLVRFLRSKAKCVDEEIVRFPATKYTGPRAQCIRGIADEAGLAINAGILGAWMGRTLLTAVGALVGKTPDSLKLAAYVGLLTLMAAALFGRQVQPAGLWAGVVLILVLCTVMVASLAQGLLGHELAFAGLQFITSVESTPDADRDCLQVVTLATTQDTTDGMRHGVYNHPDCLGTIVEGIAGPKGRRRPESSSFLSTADEASH